MDPAYDLVGVYFSVFLETMLGDFFPKWGADLFVNAVTAAVMDA